ncbi:MAG TPA: hypothetical protein PKM32_03530 [Planctomycetota bacterium]|jgi:hypothetical protein|nr:hypothetical protein [Planctomycetota bacterium]
MTQQLGSQQYYIKLYKLIFLFLIFFTVDYQRNLVSNEGLNA